MAKNVKGFITCDGRFFEDEQEADYEESLYVLTTTFESSIHSAMPTAMLVNFIEENYQSVLQHCKAFEAFKNSAKITPELEMMQKGTDYNVSNTKSDILEGTNEAETDSGGARGLDTNGNNGEEPNKSISDFDDN